MSCVPIAITRNDLKQYTGDAFFALASTATISALRLHPRDVLTGVEPLRVIDPTG